jgi:hypothetical protein
VARGRVDTTKRLDALQARKLLSRILREGAIAFSRHARDAMEDDDLTEPDVVNTLRCGSIAEGELVKGTWRYRLETTRMDAVVAFRGDSEAIIVTVWRTRERGR